MKLKPGLGAFSTVQHLDMSGAYSTGPGAHTRLLLPVSER